VGQERNKIAHYLVLITSHVTPHLRRRLVLLWLGFDQHVKVIRLPQLRDTRNYMLHLLFVLVHPLVNRRGAREGR
jgi:hypothetical protein